MWIIVSITAFQFTMALTPLVAAGAGPKRRSYVVGNMAGIENLKDKQVSMLCWRS